jgi:hypothetical protein
MTVRKAVRRWLVPLIHQGQRFPTIASVPILGAARETGQHPTNSERPVCGNYRREFPSLYY